MIDKRFIENFSWLNFSSFLNKIINFVHVVFLVRLVSQNDFGLYSLVWAHLGLLAAWQDLGTTSFGILQESLNKKHSTLNNLFSLRIILSLAVALFTIVLALIFNYPPKVILVIIALSSIYLMNAISGFLLIISSLEKKLGLPSILSLVFDTLRVLFSLIVLFITHNIYFALYAMATVYFLYALTVYIVLKHKLPPLRWQFEAGVIKEIIKKSLLFSLISFFASMYFKADFILLGKLLGENKLAIYSAGYKFFEVALILIPSYNFASIPTFKKYYLNDLKKYKQKIVSDIVFLTIISFLIILTSFLISPIIISLFFSKKYLLSLPVINILILSLPFMLLSSVFINALYAQQKEKKVILVFAFQVIFNIALNLLYIPKYGYFASAAITLVGEILNTIIFGSYLFITIKHARGRR